jgi:hypothetical protein
MPKLKICQLIDNVSQPHWPLPQVGDLNMIHRLLILLSGYDVCSFQSIYDHFMVTQGETERYLETAQYLGLVALTGTHEYVLTYLGIAVLSARVGEERIIYARAIVNSWILSQLLGRAEASGSFTEGDVNDVLRGRADILCHRHHSQAAMRRANRTIVAWIKWLAKEIGCFTITDGKYRLS